MSLENLSTGGALLVGALEVAVGELVQLMIAADGPPITVSGRVARVVTHRMHTMAAVTFLALGTRELARLSELVHRTLQRQRRECPDLVLLIGVDPEACVQLQYDLASHGHRSVAAATPLEAIWQLEDVATRFGMAIVEFDRDPSAACDLLVHLIVKHRAIRRILLSRGDPRKLARETSSWRAHACLQIPWTAPSLKELLVSNPT